MIHVCFGFIDGSGKYSKFAGASICSVFENTKSKVTIHLIHDNTLTESNREKFIELAENYRQQIKFYNLETLKSEKLQWIREQLPWTSTSFLTIGALYRLFIPELLPNEINRAIYLDSDTIANLDLNELWTLNLENKPIAAVPEGLINGGTKIGSLSNQFVVKNGIATNTEYFNSGILVMDLQQVRSRGGGGNFLESQIEFLHKNPGATLLDQVSLNFLYAKNHVSLPNRYNTFTRMISRDRTKLLEKIIYHQAGHDYSFDPSNKLHQLFLEYLMKTPFFDAESLSNLVASARKHFEDFQSLSRQIANQLAHKNRMFVTQSKDLDLIQNSFDAKSEEILCVADSELIDPLFEKLKQSKGKSFIFILMQNYNQIRDRLRKEGFVENTDFCNAMILLRDDAEIKKFHVDLTNAM